VAALLLLASANLLAENPADAKYAKLHHLSLPALSARAEQAPQDIEAQLALIRKLGQVYRDRALTRLAALDPTSLTPPQQLYYEAQGCVINVGIGDLDQAKPYCDATQQLLTDGVDAPISMAIGYNSLGFYFARQGKSTLAVKKFESGLRFLPLGSDDALRVHLIHNRGAALHMAGFDDLAITAFEEADAAKGVLPDDDQLPTILAYNLGYLQAQQGKYEGALESLSHIVPWLEETGQTTRLYIVHTQIALALTATGQHQAALDELLPWVDKKSVQVTPDSSAQAYLVLGNAYTGINNRELARQNFLTGIDIARTADNPSRLRELTLAYSGMLIASREFTAASNELKGLINASEQPHSTSDNSPAYRLLAQAQAGLGDFKKAYELSLAADDKKKSAQARAFDQRLASLRISNELDIKTQQLVLAQARETAARSSKQLAQLSIAAIIALMFGGACMAYLWQGRQNNRREAARQRETAERLAHMVEVRTQEVEQALHQRLLSEKAQAAMALRLAQDDKMRSIGQLTGGVAHDFNNLMTVILLSAELLEPELDEAQQRLVNDIIGATTSGKAITRGLLAYARQQTLRPTTIDLQDFLKSNQSLFQRSLSEAISFTVAPFDADQPTDGRPTDGRPTPLLITVDEGQLTSCLLNLVFNAREAIGHEGQVQLTFGRRGRHIAIEIRDSGRGMSSAEVTLATEPFYTTKGSAEGSGLGLSMVYGFMKQSGGELIIESQPGVGTNMVLLFDEASPTEQPNQLAPAANTDHLASKRFTILFVEDELEIRRIGQRALEKEGFNVLVAENGDVALGIINSETHVDLLVSDMVMPGSLSGEQLVTLVRQQLPDLPVLLMSGYSTNLPSDYDFLAKPFSLVELRQAVHLALAPHKHRLAKEPT
jgi:signal transduction histidine kinase